MKLGNSYHNVVFAWAPKTINNRTQLQLALNTAARALSGNDMAIIIIIRFLEWPKELKTVRMTTVYREHDGQVNGSISNGQTVS